MGAGAGEGLWKCRRGEGGRGRVRGEGGRWVCIGLGNMVGEEVVRSGSVGRFQTRNDDVCLVNRNFER